MRREAAQVRVQDHRRDHLELAAADLAGEDPAPGFRADIGVEQVDRDLVTEAGLDREREPRQKMAEDREVAVGKSARARRGPRRDHPGLPVGSAVEAEARDVGEVVGGALGAEPGQKREIQRVIARK